MTILNIPFDIMLTLTIVLLVKKAITITLSKVTPFEIPTSLKVQLCNPKNAIYLKMKTFKGSIKSAYFN
jgi:hypothetical protein